MKPIIGLTIQYKEDCSRIDMSPNYAIAVERAGGIPVILPEMKEQCDVDEMAGALDGIIFTGGEDVNPALYGAEREEECGRFSDHRDEFEVKLLKSAMARRMPIMGICRGIQLLNTALGGTLYQHIPNHRGTKHQVMVYKGSLLHECTGDICLTNSSHHQAIKKPAPGFKVLARAADGTIEAVTLEDYPFFLGIQWHPEAFWVGANDEISGVIFKRFISEVCALKK